MILTAATLAAAIIIAVAAALVTAHHTEHITYREAIRRLIHGYDREGG